MEATPISTKGYETLLDLVGWSNLAFESLKKELFELYCEESIPFEIHNVGYDIGTHFVY